MGVSTDAILLYGYVWDEELDLFPDSEWVQVLAQKRGHKDPWDLYPEEFEKLPKYEDRQRAGEEWTAANRELLDSWYELKKSVAQEFDVRVGTHCSDNCSMPYVAAEVYSAYREHPKMIFPEYLSVGRDWDTRLDRWFKELEVTKPHEYPWWFLVSYWG